MTNYPPYLTNSLHLINQNIFYVDLRALARLICFAQIRRLRENNDEMGIDLFQIKCRNLMKIGKSELNLHSFGSSETRSLKDLEEMKRKSNKF